MANNTDLYNINVIGTPVKPVQAIYVNQLVVKETISYAGMTLTGDPPTEVKSGINFNSGTGKIEFNSNISTAITFDSTITATGLITANGGITLGANMTTGSNWIRGSGANVGMKFTGANVEFSGTVDVNGTLNANGNLDVDDRIYLRKQIWFEVYDAGITVPSTGIYLWWDNADQKLKVNIAGGTYKTVQFEP